MLCEVAERGSFVTTWVALTVLALVMTLAMSGIVFWRYYVRASYETWRNKSNPAYPKPGMVRREVLTMLGGVLVATLPPSLAVHLSQWGYGHGYCGTGDYGWGYLIGSFFFVFIVTDFVEFYWHRLGHRFVPFWKHHKAHHVFYNPSPFAVIADEPLDQGVRALPMLLFPLLMPVNMDMVFFTFGALFYAYGTYLHWGHESRWLPADNPVMNTSFQHYVHHAKSTLRRPMHTGFFFKIWDQLFGSTFDKVYPGEKCPCAKCAAERGERSREAWAKVKLPDYSPLLSPRFWWTGKLPAPVAEPAADAADAAE